MAKQVSAQDTTGRDDTMSFKEWIMANVPNFHESIKTEEDLKNKVLIPYLHSLGYTDDDLAYNRSISVQVGTRAASVFSDVDVYAGGRPQMIIDTKSPYSPLSEKDILQSESYAKLVETPPAIYGVTTNGVDCVCTNVYTGQRTGSIPSKAQLARDVDRITRRPLSEVQLGEVKSALITLFQKKDLYRMIEKCKQVIEKKAHIRSDSSFREMTKILLVKMSEERRAIGQGLPNRFSIEYLEMTSRANEVTIVDVFRSLFDEAVRTYPDIYTRSDDDHLRVRDAESISDIVKALQDFSFLGTGEDIKGEVYEIFLKSTLRGELDQYFTPREIVTFMVQYADPEIGEVMLDLACGSGGFVINSFQHVNQKIIDAGGSEVERKKRFDNLIRKCLWGQEADYELTILAKINLIMHGDGWNNIHEGDSIRNPHFSMGEVDLVITNPPFTIRYDSASTLSGFELGIGRLKQELDILFVEQSVRALKEGGELFIVLPEGMTNLPTYQYFREWLLKNTFLLMSVGLPEGAFVPFGKSASKTCILGLRKRSKTNPDEYRPKYVFIGDAKEIGYETGKRDYRTKDPNDLPLFLQASRQVFETLLSTPNGGECGWIDGGLVTDERFDASYLLIHLDQERLRATFSNVALLREVCTINNKKVNPRADKDYYYLEVPDIQDCTGTISNIRKLSGAEITKGKHMFRAGDLLLARINPRLSRVVMIPDEIAEGLTSPEVYVVELVEGNPYVTDKVVLRSILQSEFVRNQIARLGTGSSSSRSRVSEDYLLDHVLVPVLAADVQADISRRYAEATSAYWQASQQLLKEFSHIQKVLESEVNPYDIRRV